MEKEVDSKWFHQLHESLDGQCHIDPLSKIIYATDASVYREKPIAVCIPKNDADLRKIIAFTKKHSLSIIPRAGGTSLAGQCVGNGIVVDISKHFNEILEFNQEEQWVRVQPGVVRDQLNQFLKPFGFFFSPITSTANRATIGGMVGNNSCGTTSIQYGSTRDHVLALKTILSDGSIVTFDAIDTNILAEKKALSTLEGKIYREIDAILSNEVHQKNIQNQFPKDSIHRRNTGYALDILLASEPYLNQCEAPLNLCKLLCGSEGTLAFTTEIKLHVDPLPPQEVLVVAAHFDSIDQSLKATKIAMEFNPSACELMDKIILDCTKENAEQRKNRFFVEGDPKAILTVEFRGETKAAIQSRSNQFIEELRKEDLSFACPVIYGAETNKIWKLRSAGLGLLANIPGDKKTVACIEDTAVDLADLPEYIEEFTQIMQSFGQKSVYYAHAGAGELHLRPILNLKDPDDVQAFYDISLASAKLVKKYKGSLSGEHGDGRVRAAFIPLMVGEENYNLFRQIKSTWDPEHLFNPGKIVDAPPMNSSLRYDHTLPSPNIETILDFSHQGGILRAAEQCNGSGDCRKTHHFEGTMCPSFHITKNEKDTTRARANALREILSTSSNKNPFDQEELKEVMDLCLSCKACKTECPSNVDMSSLKAEFQYQYYKSNSIPWRAKLFGHINDLNRIGSYMPRIYNFLLQNRFLSSILKKTLGVSPQRNLPIIQQQSLRSWYIKNYRLLKPSNPIKSLYIFCDAFTNYNDTHIGIKAIQLLSKLGYHCQLIQHHESGRSALSKGLLNKAKKHATANVQIFKDLISEDCPLIGIEPSSILSFRDEYPRLVDKKWSSAASKIAKHSYLIDEFIAIEIRAHRITEDAFTQDRKQIIFHAHCHQKALSDQEDSIWMMQLPKAYTVQYIPSGCCGMAGSFGYEKEHYESSQKIANLILFPAIEKSNPTDLIAATGTSCRHQITDKYDRKALHPVEILHDACIL